MSDRQQLYAGSWNTQQKMPHREPLFEYLKESVGKALMKQPQEWILVSVGDYDQVGADLEQFEEILKNGEK